MTKIKNKRPELVDFNKHRIVFLEIAKDWIKLFISVVGNNHSV